MEICNPTECTGCEACKSVCPNKAISLLPNDKGFLYPQIDSKLCVECNLCRNICPSNKEQPQSNFSQKVYAVWNKNNKIRFQSSSGGTFSAIAKTIINDGGYVFGAKWTSDFSVVHSYTNNEAGLYEFRGSKYVQSRIDDCFIKAKEFLSSGKKVLFSGTPCQIAGLKAFLKKDCENLITVDLICHGVPTQTALDKYKAYLLKDKPNDKITDIKLRYKIPGWSLCSVKVEFKKAPTYINSCLVDPYFTLFNKKFFLRECCYNCKYTSTNRQGDITLADFWGYQPKHWYMRNFDKGVSCVIVNSEKGHAMFDVIKGSLTYEERTMQDAINSNKSLIKPYPRDKRYEDFWENFERLDMGELHDKYCSKPQLPKSYLLTRLKGKYRAFIPQGLINLIKKLKV